MSKPKPNTKTYYDYLIGVKPWLLKELPQKYKIQINGDLWDAIQSSVEGAHDATVYLDFEVLESYLGEGEFTDAVIEKLKELVVGDDSDGIEIDVSW